MTRVGSSGLIAMVVSFCADELFNDASMLGPKTGGVSLPAHLTSGFIAVPDFKPMLAGGTATTPEMWCRISLIWGALPAPTAVFVLTGAPANAELPETNRNAATSQSILTDNSTKRV